ncbi:MAG: triose-phosphate isomerase [Patescibacteria group bacterium]
MPHKLLIANWKANPESPEEARALFEAENNPGVIICPPAVYLEELHANGAQDVFWEGGAHTGEVSPEMLKELGVTHVLVGHSERRAIGETDEQINQKLKALLNAGMTPVLLIGEPEKSAARSDYLIDQLTRDLEGVSADGAAKIMFCYEPVWAIGTHAANLDDVVSAIHEMQSILDKMYGFKPSMLYGGSVNEKNLADFLNHPEISGAVVGGASLKAEEFKNMIEIATKL